MCAFLTLYKDTQCSEVPYWPHQLYQALQKSNKGFLKLLNGKHQDPHEFFLMLVETIENQKHSVHWFKNNFTTDIKTEIECLLCKKIYETTGCVGDLALDINRITSLQEALDGYFRVESIDFKCTDCNKQVAAKKKQFIVSAPNCLTLQLKRFSKQNKKININLNYAPELNLSTYFLERQSREWKYKLVGVINHIGETLEKGHYIATVCTANEVCYEFDDSNVSEINTGIGTYNEAYLLFYELTKVILKLYLN